MRIWSPSGVEHVEVGMGLARDAVGRAEQLAREGERGARAFPTPGGPWKR